MGGGDDDVDNHDEKQEEEEEDGNKKYQRLILFVGQIPFTASAADVEKHFADHGAGKVKVRLLTEKGTGKSRGMAFVDFDSPQHLVRGLRVHHTRLQGRAINVERTVGGGGNNENRKEKLKQLRDYQGSRVRKEVEILVDETIAQSQGLLTKEICDDLVVRSLCCLPRVAVKQVLDEILESDIHHARNKKAWILGCVKRYTDRIKSGERFLTLEEEKAGIIEKRKQEYEPPRTTTTATATTTRRRDQTSSAGNNNNTRTSTRDAIVKKFKRGGIGNQ